MLKTQLALLPPFSASAEALAVRNYPAKNAQRQRFTAADTALGVTLILRGWDWLHDGLFLQLELPLSKEHYIKFDPLAGIKGPLPWLALPSAARYDQSLPHR